jgi:hypothetical protein
MISSDRVAFDNAAGSGLPLLSSTPARFALCAFRPRIAALWVVLRFLFGLPPISGSSYVGELPLRGNCCWVFISTAETQSRHTHFALLTAHCSLSCKKFLLLRARLIGPHVATTAGAETDPTASHQLLRTFAAAFLLFKRSQVFFLDMRGLIRKFFNIFNKDSRVICRKSDVAQRPHVLILGWGGSKARQVEKVAEFYDKIGVDSTSFIMPLGIPNFARVALVQDLALKLPRSSSGIVKPLYVHSFSNNGAWTYAALCMLEDASGGKLLARAGAEVVRGLVMDSAPHLFYEHWDIKSEVYLYARVVTSIILGRAQYEHSIVSPIVRCWLYIACLFHRVLRYVQLLFPWVNIIPPYIAMNIFLRDKTPAVPTLMMYSNDDGLVSPRHVEQFVHDLQQRYKATGQNPAQVRTMRFSGVEHTAPFFARATRQQYRDELSRFLEMPAATTCKTTTSA